MRHNKGMQIVLTPEILLAAYAQGLFPMAERRDTPYVHWVCPEKRGQFSIPFLHVPRRLKKSVRQMKIVGKPYEIHINSDFTLTINGCSEYSQRRNETWINDPIRKAFCTLHEEGHAHSVECWQGGQMVGGLYGLAIGGAFFGESMFSKVTDASKVCLVHLVARLWKAEFGLLDTQFVNEHLRQFGVYEVSYQDYMCLLRPLLSKKCVFETPYDEKNLASAYLDWQDQHKQTPELS